MVNRSVMTVALCAMLTGACGGSPTSPQPIDVRANASGADVPAPAPGPAPAPAPSPAEPAPAPSPSPAPSPGSPVETWYATVDVQRASSPDNALPATFTVTVSGDQMMFGPLEVKILVRQGAHIYARKGTELTIQIDDGKWTVTSVDVFATGTISYSAP
jgi:hypothetical protein